MGPVRRRLAFAALLLLAHAPARAAGEAERVGQVSQPVRQVQGREGDQQPRDLRDRDPVWKLMWVQTFVKARTDVTLGQSAWTDKGRVRLGPDTEVRFEDWVADLAAGRINRLSLKVALGQIWMAFAPTPKGLPREGQYDILTPGGTIRLEGTDVYVKVEPDGTTSVYVREGSVRIQPNTGGELVLKAGFWTRMHPEGPAAPPSRFEPADFDPPVDPEGRDLGPPGEKDIIDPPELDVRDPRLELPKSGGPPA